METVYFYSAVIGGTILGLQTLLIVFAGGDGDGHVDVHDGDVGDHADGADHHDSPADSFLKYLSFKTVVAFATFFGLTGLACGRAELSSEYTLLASIGAGTGALVVVGYIMQALAGLHSEGNLDLKNSVGSVGTVYLKIPGSSTGQGKVTVTFQGRTSEVKAITRGSELATGSKVKVVALSGADTLEVQACEGSPTHA